MPSERDARRLRSLAELAVTRAQFPGEEWSDHALAEFGKRRCDGTPPLVHISASVSGRDVLLMLPASGDPGALAAKGRANRLGFLDSSSGIENAAAAR